METWVFIFAIIGFIYILFFWESMVNKKNDKLFVKKLREGYGRESDREISYDRFPHISIYHKKHGGKYDIDDITWNDLNLDQIFMRMNYTQSSTGEEYLYHTLHNCGNNKRELEEFENTVKYFHENEDKRVELLHIMSKLGHSGKYSIYEYLDNLNILGERSSKKELFFNCLFIPLIALIPFATTISVVGLIVLAIYNIVNYFPKKKEIEPYIASFAYCFRLFNTCNDIKKLNLCLNKEQLERLDNYVDCGKKMRRGTFFLFNSSVNSMSGDPIKVVMDYFMMLFHLDIIQFNKVLGRVKEHYDDIDGTISVIGYLETAVSVAYYRESIKGSWCVPVICEEKRIEINDCRHPLLTDPVSNDIAAERGVLLTGSNASGKSTFLKSVAINAILAQTINTCVASYYKAPLFAVYSSMSLRDDVICGDSYYMAEIKAIKRILEAASELDRPVICFVDEVLRGTNTVERIAASTQILKNLIQSGAIIFAATHDIELTSLLEDVCDNYHFEEKIIDNDIFFPYKLIPGPAVTRNAIKLLEITGFNKKLIDEASVLASKFMSTGKWM